MVKKNSLMSFEQKTYHTLEIYPPTDFDEVSIIKKEGELSNSFNEDTLNQIMKYIKEEWLPSEREIPLYVPTTWITIDTDMKKLSEKFLNYVFVILGKGEYFIDNVWSKIYKNGQLVILSNNIDHTINLRLPNGDSREITNNKISVNQAYDIGKYFPSDDKSFMAGFNIATNIGTMLGTTAASVGSMVTEAALAAKVVSIGIAILDEMQRNLNNYGKNRGRCKNLAERCNNIIITMQNVPSENLRLQYVITVVNKIEEAKNLISEYVKRWRITRFFLSGEYLDSFSAANQNLSDAFYDFVATHIMKTI